jgi:hypothetical protein
MNQKRTRMLFFKGIGWLKKIISIFDPCFKAMFENILHNVLVVVVLVLVPVVT